MGDSAYVAFETSNGRFDVHYSDNGAGELGALVCLLADWVNSESRKRPGDSLSFGKIPQETRERLAASAKLAFPDEDQIELQDNRTGRDAIDQDPVEVQVERSEIGKAIDFTIAEVLIVVTESELEFIAPVWLNLNIFQPLMAADIEIKAWEIDDRRVKDIMGSDSPPSPDVEFHSSEAREVANRDGGRARDVFERIHRDAYEMLVHYRNMLEQIPRDRYSLTITYPDLLVSMGVAEIDHLPPVKGYGVLVDVGSWKVRPIDQLDEEGEGQLAEPLEGLPRARSKADELRFEVATGFSPLEPDDNHLTIKKDMLLLTRLVRDAPGTVVDWSPDPFGEAIRMSNINS